MLPLVCVSILTRREGRVRPACDYRKGAGERVSILTRREGRVRQDMMRFEEHAAEFQSSPGAKAGCDNATAAATPSTIRVSILTRREGRVRRRGGVWTI